MAERNAHIPFPELIGQSRSLESIVIDLAHEKSLVYDQLPQVITAGDIETYANWISDLTHNDTTHAERGAVLHVRASDNTIIYPSNPDVGDDSSCGWVLSKKRNLFTPTIDIHSHPIDVCHSPIGADMSTLLSGWGGNENDTFSPLGMLVTTPEHNYLIIKTNKTPSEEDAVWINRSGGSAFYQFRRYGTEFGQSASDTDWRRLLKIVEKDVLGMSIEHYYENFTEVLRITEHYHLGFYRSNKDGNYERATREMVMQQMTEYLNNAFITALTLHSNPHA